MQHLTFCIKYTDLYDIFAAAAISAVEPEDRSLSVFSGMNYSYSQLSYTRTLRYIRGRQQTAARRYPFKLKITSSSKTSKHHKRLGR